MKRFSKLLSAPVDIGIFIAYFGGKNVSEHSTKFTNTITNCILSAQSRQYENLPTSRQLLMRTWK